MNAPIFSLHAQEFSSFSYFKWSGRSVVFAVERGSDARVLWRQNGRNESLAGNRAGTIRHLKVRFGNLILRANLKLFEIHGKSFPLLWLCPQMVKYTNHANLEEKLPDLHLRRIKMDTRDNLYQFLITHGWHAGEAIRQRGNIEKQFIDLIRVGGQNALNALGQRIQTNEGAVYGFDRVLNSIEYSPDADFGNCLGPSEAIFRKIDDENGVMLEFLSRMQRPFQTFLQVANYGGDYTIEIGWFDHIPGQTQVTRVLWERWNESIGNPVISYVAMSCLFDQSEYRYQTKKKENDLPPMYRYHPERYKTYRNFADLAGKIYRQQAIPTSGVLTVMQMNQIAGLVTLEMNERNMNCPRKHSDNLPPPSLALESELTLVTAYGRFVQAGRQIMDFPPGLTEMFTKTDIDDMRLDSLKMPYASQYLYFGREAEIELEPGWLVEGAYVESRGDAGDIRFTITAVPNDPFLSTRWNDHPEPCYTQDFVQHYRSMDIATAIDYVLAENRRDLNKRAAAEDRDITQQAQDAFAQRGEELPENIHLVDVSSSMSKKRIALSNQRHPAYLAALRLVVNALCYVTAYSDDIATVWPAGTPEALKQKAMLGKGKEVMRAKSKLASLGYVPVHICGQRIAEQRQIAQSNRSHGRAVHWRRGHWRNQAHGAGRAFRKLIWVMPSIIGAEEEGADTLGHLYLVS